MTIIPFAEALKLLNQAYNIHVTGYETKSFILPTEADVFLTLHLEEQDYESYYQFQFTEASNQTVTIDGTIMVLSDISEDGTKGTLAIQLMVPLPLEPSVGEVHKYQCELESSLCRILEQCDDAASVRRHARVAKHAFDWLDNFTTVKAAQPDNAEPPTSL